MGQGGRKTGLSYLGSFLEVLLLLLLLGGGVGLLWRGEGGWLLLLLHPRGVQEGRHEAVRQVGRGGQRHLRRSHEVGAKLKQVSL